MCCAEWSNGLGFGLLPVDWQDINFVQVVLSPNSIKPSGTRIEWCQPEEAFAAGKEKHITTTDILCTVQERTEQAFMSITDQLMLRLDYGPP